MGAVGGLGVWGRLQQKQDQEAANHQQKITDLINKRAALVEKANTLKGTPEYDDTFNALRQVDTDLRLAYDPEKHPGAIASFGHLLTDHLGITKPQERIKKEAAKRAEGLATDERTALSDVAAGPLSPEQQAGATGRMNLAAIQAAIRNYDAINKNATPEDRQTYINSLIQNPKAQLGKWDRITGKVKGQPTTLLYNEKTGEYKTQTGESVPQETLDAFIPDPKEAKPGTSKFSMNVESYKKLHGIPPDQSLTPDQLNFVEQQIALASAAPSTNITTSVKQDVNGMYVPITESNRHIPGFGTILHDPLGSVNSTPNSAVNPPSATPKPKGGVKVAPTPAGEGTTKVGTPLFQGRTPAIAKAQNDVVEAAKLSSIADQVATKPNDAINQKRLAVALERASAGRFTVQALDYIIKAGWGNTIQQWANNPTTGALPADVLRQLVDGAHENLKAAQEALKTALTPIAATGGGPPQTDNAKPQHYIGEVVTLKNGQKLTISVIHSDGSFE
jgi:hypothetical protein